jgi:hypothetical protein
VEFVHEKEIDALIEDYNLSRVTEGDDRVYIRMEDSDDTVHVHLACAASQAEPVAGATMVSAEKDRLPAIIEHIIHLLHMEQIVLVPVGKWRRVFDAVAFSLASNEDWQEMDATASVELNTRDPLLCEPADFHTLIALIEALFNDADQPDQGIVMLTAAAPVLIEIVPDGAVRIALATPALADQLEDVLSK